MGKKNLVSGIISGIIIGAGILAYLISAIINLVHISGLVPLKEVNGLINKGEFVQAELTDVKFIGNVTNSYGFIPTGKEYYYIAVDDKTDTAYFIRASKNLKYKEGPVTVKGKVRTADTVVERSFGDRMDEYAGEGYKKAYVSKALFIDNTIAFQSILRIITTVFIVGGIAVLILNPSMRKPANTLTRVEKALLALGIVPILAGLLLAAYTTTFMF